MTGAFDFRRVDAVLEEIERDCVHAGWDGPGSQPVDGPTLRVARAWLAALRDIARPDLAMPEVVPEADGDVRIDWDVDLDRYVVVSVSLEGWLHYTASTPRRGRVHGRVRFDVRASPESQASVREIRALIDEIAGTG